MASELVERLRAWAECDGEAGPIINEAADALAAAEARLVRRSETIKVLHEAHVRTETRLIEMTDALAAANKRVGELEAEAATLAATRDDYLVGLSRQLAARDAEIERLKAQLNAP